MGEHGAARALNMDTGWFAFAIMSALCISLAAMLEKRALRDVHTIDFALSLSSLAALVSLGILAFVPFPPVPSMLLIGLVPSTGAAALAYFCAARAMRHLPISVASPLMLLTPVITAILAYLILREALSPVHLAGFSILIFGLYVFETHQLRGWREFYAGLFQDGFAVFAVVATLLYGCTSLFDRVVLGWWHVPALQYVVLAQIGVGLWMLIIARVAERVSISDGLRTIRRTGPLVVLIVILTVSQRLFQSHATALAPVALVSAVKYSSVFFTVTIGGTLFHEDGLLRRAVGTAIMIAGLCLIALF